MTSENNVQTEHIRCNLCGADDYTQRIPSSLEKTEKGNWKAYACTSGGYGHHGPIVQCRRCGFVYASPRRTSDAVLDIYQTVEDPLYLEERAGRILTFEKHLKAMEKFTGAADKRSLLDVGAYTGVFVEIAAQHGWDAWGVEPSSWAIEQARGRGLNMKQGTLEGAAIEPESFEVITMWDVIEHVTDPCETMRAAWRALKPGGYLVVHTMNIDSLFARIMGRRWPWFMEMHLFYFSKNTMAQMLEKSGFAVKWAGAQGRYLQAGYLASRVTALMPWIGKPLEKAITKLNLRKKAVRINLGDLFTTYAQKI